MKAWWTKHSNDSYCFGHLGKGKVLKYLRDGKCCAVILGVSVFAFVIKRSAILFFKFDLFWLGWFMSEFHIYGTHETQSQLIAIETNETKLIYSLFLLFYVLLYCIYQH